MGHKIYSSALIVAFTLLAAIDLSGQAMARSARCALSGAVRYQGKCEFTNEGASFSLSPMGRSSFPGGINPVSVAVVSPGVAEVRGLTRDGVNSRWGVARRSKRDPACWMGNDFRICAY